MIVNVWKQFFWELVFASVLNEPKNPYDSYLQYRSRVLGFNFTCVSHNCVWPRFLLESLLQYSLQKPTYRTIVVQFACAI